MGSTKRQIDTYSLSIDESHPQYVSAIGRGAAILRCFEHGERHLGNREIARRTGLPKATVSRLTYTLSCLGLLSYSQAREKYALGTAVLTLAHCFLRGNEVLEIARPLMRELAESTRAAVMLGEAERGRMVLLDIVEGDPSFELNLAPGARVPHGSTALGRADLAARPQPVFDRLMHELERECEPGYFPRLKAGILRAREDCRHYGFCFSMGDWNPDVFAVGVPLVSADGDRVLALNCSGRVSLMTRERILDEIGPRLVALRDRVLAVTGGRF
ncbi:IclR family transcriptional regulator [Pseudomarimonas salicorniae]|uniref:IclR family transcriptional regulator n=1 Tax=Pseudomarimonas salicorniae TaxID=2933270 RepID=A0ABT0GEM4_9GAMM|nr:IclR family transcriptional regulator [Lysobacter sp. CAU 1642]MCK7593001.1 IclR family transcriptional regulator [Lysobacter sp. CAU 1642]